MHRRLLLALCSAVASCAMVCNAQSITDAPAAAKDEPDPADLWRQVLEHSDHEAIMATYAVAASLHASDGSIDPAACKAKAHELEDALQTNPVGLALWYAAYQCAQSLQDDALATRRMARFGSLIHYAVDSGSRDYGLTPIRVLTELDVVAFIKASGQTVLYSYYEPVVRGRNLPLWISLWDAQSKRERLLSFDYLDSRMQLMRSQPYTEFPLFRKMVADNFLKMFGEAAKGSIADDALQLKKIMTEGDFASRMTHLQTEAQGGNFSATMAYVSVCLVVNKGNCGKQAVDLLLPLAEDSRAIALVMLALAYDEGTGVKKDRANARALLEAADRRLGEGRGTLIFCGLAALRASKIELNADVRKTLDRLAAEHIPAAESILAADEMSHAKDKALRPATLTMLRHAATSGIAAAQNLLAVYLGDHGEKAESLRWLQAAAAANDGGAQRYLATAYEHGGIVDQNPDLARKWHAEAGRSGNRESMVWMGRYYRSQPVSKESLFHEQGWLQSAAIAGSVDGALDLANLYEQGGEGIEGDEKQAVVIYRNLAKDYDSAEARYRLADLLVFSHVIDHDLNEARRLLSIDADKGDLRARRTLGSYMATGKYGDDKIAEGRNALQQVAESGDATAMTDLGSSLYYNGKRDRRSALGWWQKAVDKGNRSATNNLAWALCTAPEPTLLDPARGTQLAKTITQGSDAPLAYLDTLAACNAASGDFGEAEATERDVVKHVQASKAAANAFIEHANKRIELFHQRKPYIETDL